MPEYLFIYLPTRAVVRRRMTMTEAAVFAVDHPEYQRIYDPPNVHSLPGYREAYEESEQVLRDRKRQQAAMGRDALDLIRQGLREEGHGGA